MREILNKSIATLQERVTRSDFSLESELKAGPFITACLDSVIYASFHLVKRGITL